MLIKNKNRLSLFRKTLMILVLLALLRVGATIPTPFANRTMMEAYLSTNQAAGLLNLFSGNSLSSMSIMALSITPYINATIILQLLGIIWPKMAQLSKGTEQEQRQYKTIAIVLGGILGAVESYGMVMTFGRQGLISPFHFWTGLCVVLIWTGAAILTSIIGELITKRYYGNGVSLILAVNILSGYLSDWMTVYRTFVKGKATWHLVLVLVFLFGLFLFTTLVTDTEKHFPIQYSSKVRGDINAIGETALPIKLCPGTVVPVIFALTLLSVPSMIELFTGKTWAWTRWLNQNYWFHPSQMQYTVGAIAYVLLIIFMTYYYSSLVMSPIEIAQNLERSDGVIVGVKSGEPTVRYLKDQMRVMLLIGALGMSAISLIPIILSGVYSLGHLSFMGTSIIITAGVLVETRKAFRAQLRSAQYKKKVGLFG